MITKQQTPERRPGRWLPVLLIVAGAAWLLARRQPEPPAATVTAGPFATTPGRTPGPEASRLSKLSIDVDAGFAQTLQAARDRAMSRGMIVTSDQKLVPARVELDGKAAEARIRLKGDWIDHVDSDRWSLRVELEKQTLAGMQRFSIQHPKTRGFLMEWLIMRAARHLGLLAPHSEFVHVTVNGRPSGVYYLEEHFAKELLESQGRRDGPIVRFREDTLWQSWLQYGEQKVPAEASFAGSQAAAEVAAYDEDRLARVDALNLRLRRALEQMRDLQRLALADEPRRSLPAWKALQELQGRTIDDLFVSDKFGRMVALYALFNAYHGFSWLQLRLYHDPVLDRLEPIVFDTGANPLVDRTDVLLLQPGLREVLRSQDCYEATFRALAELTQPSWLDALFAEVGADFERFGRALTEDGLIPATIDLGVLPERLRQNAVRLRRLVSPADPVNFAAQVVPAADEHGEAAAIVDVEAWATTMAPVLIDGFSFSNGRKVTAASALAAADLDLRRPGGAAVLPRQGRRVRFRFALDDRLASLRSLQQLKRAMRQQTEQDRSVKVRIDVEFRTFAADAATREQLHLRRAADLDDPTTGRPAPPALAAAIERHACLAFDSGAQRLYLRRGSWDVDGDLLVPAGHTLFAEPGTTLRFAPGAVLCSDAALRFVGTEADPVVLEARQPERGFGGIVVMEAGDTSRFEHVIVRGAASIERGGWQTTGGVTFYRAPVDLLDTRILDAHGEDALNLFGVRFSLVRCTFAGGPSDLFDGDFVQGRVQQCTFADSGEDAIDVSGSEVTVEGCSFARIGDKAVSVGEDSHLLLRDAQVADASLVLAAKDSSRVEIERLTARQVRYYVLAAYVKKDTFGPSHVVAHGLDLEPTAEHLVQQGCSVEIDGRPLAGRPVDVADLYRRKILGK